MIERILRISIQQRSLILMAVSNASFAALAAAGHTNIGMAAAIGFENFASGIGGVTVNRIRW